MVRVRLRGELVFVDQAAEAVATAKPIEREDFARPGFLDRWRPSRRYSR
jgi:hypothetical protein